MFLHPRGVDSSGWLKIADTCCKCQGEGCAIFLLMHPSKQCIVIKETLIDERTEVAKHACDTVKSIGNREGEVVICNVVSFSLSRCTRVIGAGGKKCNALPGRLVGAGFGGSGQRGGCNCQGFGEDVNCVWGTVVGGKFNKLCCMPHYCAIGIEMLWMGQNDSDTASNGEACGGQQICDSRGGGCLLILEGFFSYYASGECVAHATECTLNGAGCSACLLQALEELWREKKTHSVFDSDVPCPMCISNPNRAK